VIRRRVTHSHDKESQTRSDWLEADRRRSGTVFFPNEAFAGLRRGTDSRDLCATKHAVCQAESAPKPASACSFAREGGGDVHAHINIRDVDAANFSLQTTRLGSYILHTPKRPQLDRRWRAHDSAAKAQGWVSHFFHGLERAAMSRTRGITYM
jgi:hypothetical protein